MPIRFRCAYCNQLMGISKRKVGNVVRCPKCGGQVVVPNPEEGQAADEGPEDPNAPAHALEDPELERLLAGVDPKPNSPRGAPRHFKSPELAFDVEPVDMPAAPGQPTTALPRGMIAMPRWILYSLAFLVLLLAGLAFLVGYLLGKQAGG